MARKLRTLLFSTLYPSEVRPIHGLFVENRLREVIATGAVETTVVAPVPWFPSRHPRWGDYARFARVPAREQRHGIEVLHPRYALIPKVGMTLAPALLALACVGPLHRLIEGGFDFDLIDAHYFYPDGVAAAWLARHFGKPLLITARGSDVNLIGEYALARRQMRWAAGRAGACIAVSQALADRLAALGVSADKLRVLRNGVDLERFQPVERAEAQRRVGLDAKPLLLSVGNLIPLKGHELCIDALAALLPQHPGAALAIVGAGPLAQALREHAERRGVAQRVHLIGPVAQRDLAAWYSAADLLLLASSREGWPNVLLEAMACGAPVVATAVGGVPEIVGDERAGRLVRQRDGASLAAKVNELLAAAVDRGAVRRYAEGFGWAPTTQAQIDLFNQLARGAHPERAAADLPGLPHA